MYDANPAIPLSLLDFVRAAKTRVREVAPREAQHLMEATDLLVVDVREAGEHEQGHLPNAMLVPRGILEAAADPSYPKHVQALSSARERPILLYCATGGRSAMAAATLQMMGFKHVLSLEGGITKWEQEGLPLVREARYV